MAASVDDLKLRLQSGRESLDTELKPWLDPTTDVGKATIAKACMALRNTNGGYLIIGMRDDGTGDTRYMGSDLHARFHHDSVQEIVSKFSSEPFEITVHFVEYDGNERVMIEVPTGVRTPVICRNNLPRQKTVDGHEPGSLLAENVVFVRTLNSNGRPSSAPAKFADWPRIMETCFNNRETDIGAFMRRQLSGLDIGSASAALFEVLKAAKAPTATEAADEFLNKCYEKFLKHRKNHQQSIPDVGFREIAAVIVGGLDCPELDQSYMWRLAQVPRYSGWPPFVSLMNVDSGFGNVNYDENGLESFEYVTNVFHSLDFSRIERTGKFYYAEGLRDDLVKQIKPREQLEFVIETARISEVIAIVLLFAKTFCGNDSENQVCFAFRWRGVANRRLTSWANPGRCFFSNQASVQDELLIHATIPVSIAIDAIGLHVEAIVKPLFRLFGGWAFDSNVIQQIVTGRLNQQL